MLNPKECKHEHTKKAGRQLQSGRVRQRLQCLECGKVILDGEYHE